MTYFKSGILFEQIKSETDWHFLHSNKLGVLITCPERSSLCRGHTAWLLAGPLDLRKVRVVRSSSSGLGGEVATPPSKDFFLAVMLRSSMNNEAAEAKRLTFSNAGATVRLAEHWAFVCK